MKFGLDLLPDCQYQSKPAENYFDESLALTEIAESYGFESVKIVEHHFKSYGGYSPNALIFLASAAQRTKKMRLVSGCVLPAFSHPLKIAGELAMVDVLSHGRLEAGFARAFLPHEFEAFQVPMDESTLRFREGIDIVVNAWKNDILSYEGELFQFEGVTTLPRPVQRPHPPVWIAVINTSASFEYAGKMGYNLMVVPYFADFPDLKEKLHIYKEAYRKNGHGEANGNNMMMVLHLYTEQDDQTAKARAQKYMEKYLQSFAEAATAWDSTSSSAYPGYTNMGHYLREFTYERILHERRAAIGNPQSVQETIEFYQDYFGINYLTLQVNFGEMEFELAKNSLELFGREVLPAIQRNKTLAKG